MVKQSAPGLAERLRRRKSVIPLYGSNRPLSRGVGRLSERLAFGCRVDEFVRHDVAFFRTSSALSGDQDSPGRFDPKNATLPSQLPDPRFWTPAIAEGGASSSASKQHESRRQRVALPQSM